MVIHRRSGNGAPFSMQEIISFWRSWLYLRKGDGFVRTLDSEASEVFWTNGKEAIVTMGNDYHLRSGNSVVPYGNSPEILKDKLKQAGRTDIIDSLISQGKL